MSRFARYQLCLSVGACLPYLRLCWHKSAQSIDLFCLPTGLPALASSLSLMSFKALRRSRDAKGQRPISASTPLSTPNGPAMLSKPMSAKSFVPDKVIRAVESRRATAPQELSFSKGDFFYVTKDVDLRGCVFWPRSILTSRYASYSRVLNSHS